MLRILIIAFVVLFIFYVINTIIKEIKKHKSAMKKLEEAEFLMDSIEKDIKETEQKIKSESEELAYLKNKIKGEKDE